jgi:hypothetical protein
MVRTCSYCFVLFYGTENARARKSLNFLRFSVGPVGNVRRRLRELDFLFFAKRSVFFSEYWLVEIFTCLIKPTSTDLKTKNTAK